MPFGHFVTLLAALVSAPLAAMNAQRTPASAARCRAATTPEATVTACRVAVRGLPNDATSRRALANALALLGRREEALSEMYEATRLDPSNAAVWDELALTAYSLGRYDEAVSYWDRSRRLDRSVVDGSPATRSMVAKARARLTASHTTATSTTPRAVLRSGIGFPISDSGYVMTSGELIYRCPEVMLRSSAGDARGAQVVAVDHLHDLAVLRVEGPIPPAIPFRGGSAPRAGERLFLLSFPADSSASPLRDLAADRPSRGRERGQLLRVVGNVRVDRAAPIVDAEGRLVAVFGRLDDRTRYEAGRGDAAMRVRAAVDGRAVRDFLRLDGVPHRITRRDRNATPGQRELLLGRSAIRVECRR